MYIMISALTFLDPNFSFDELQRGGFLRKIWVLKIIFVEMTPQERVKIDVLE